MIKINFNAVLASVLGASLFLPSCVSPRSAMVFGFGDRTITSTEGPGGSTKTWKVGAGHGQFRPTLLESDSTVRNIARLGVRCSPLRTTARDGAAPPVGLAIHEVIANSAAERAGLTKGNILLQVDGVDLSNSATLRNCMAKLTDPKQAIEVTVLDRSPSETPSSAPEPRRLKIVPDQVAVTDTEKHRHTLRASFGVQHYTGLQAATVAAEQATRLYGVDEPALIVTGVVGGSPAYYAGLRAGDRIQKVNGVPATLDELKVAVYNQVKKMGWRMPLYDLAIPEGEYRLDLPLPLMPELQLSNPDLKGTELTLEVDGPLGPHSTKLPLTRESLDTVAEFNLPGILTINKPARGTGIQFLDPGFTIGFDYRSYARPSETREPSYSYSLDLLPFGMFRVKSWPSTGEDEVTLFWFLTF